MEGTVTTLDGSALPLLHTSRNYQCLGLIVASSAAVHQDLLNAVQAAIVQRGSIGS